MTDPLVSIIVVARDEEANIARCLEGIAAQKAGFAREVIVVDSGSRDNTAKVAEGFGARVIRIGRGDFQHGRTRQMASEAARGEYLVYIVADAEPAGENWLAALVGAVAGDGRVAGAYSRQLPRPGAGPVEAHRLQHRRSSGGDREVREVIGAADFWSMSPKERFALCEFDDVSCCRRASLLAELPIPAVDWAEDLAWARDALLAGHRIVFEPESAVRHSHPDTVAHAFRRGYLDQLVVKRWFGVLYFDGVGPMLKGFPALYRGQAAAILEARLGPAETLRLLGWNVFRLGAEMLGNRAAALEPRGERIVADLRERLGKGARPGVTRSGTILRTRFTLGADSRPTLFMNPRAAAETTIRLPPGARLRLGAALNPECWDKRRSPVLFMATVDGAPVWTREIFPGDFGGEPEWVDADIDLSSWAQKRVRLGLVTWSGDTDHAWAGWGRPRVVTPGPGIFGRLYNAVLGRVAGAAGGKPLRHP